MRIPLTAGGAYEAAILVLEDEGLTGLGEGAARAARGEPLVRVVEELRSGRPVSGPARCAWDTALLDLEARRAGLPLCELLGGRRRSGVECSALFAAGRAAEVAAGVEQWRARGFTAFELGTVNAGGALDLERVGAARWAGGPGARLRLDLGGRLDLGRAAAALPSLDRFHLELVVQPLPAAAPVEQWRALAAACGLPVAARHSLADPAAAGCLAAAGFALAVELATVGGPRGVIPLAVRGSGPVTVGSAAATSIGIAAGLHVACALEREPLACGLATRSRLGGDVAAGLGADGPRLDLPDGPGLGLELDRAALARYRLDR